MKIAVIGATGMVGSAVVAEAARRGHDVTAVTRHGSAIEGAGRVLAMDLTDVADIASLVSSQDTTVIAVPGNRATGETEPIVEAHRALIETRPAGRLLVVGGAGSLLVDGVLLKDTPDFPEAYKSEAEAFTTVLEAYRASQGVDWTLISPAPEIAPGPAAEHYETATDSPAGGFITNGTLAVAILDEIENPAHREGRFTAAQ